MRLPQLPSSAQTLPLPTPPGQRRVPRKEQNNDDPEVKWITTWNHYLNRLRLFFRRFHNLYVRRNEESQGELDWQTPDMVRIKSRKSKRVSPYLESDIAVKKFIRNLFK
jgi:hypothetical protein